jgi:PTS system nitrogen regulatory IIA component
VHLGATLRLLRLENGFGLRDLARRLGVSSAYLSRVENGVDPVPTADRLEAIARALDLPPALLIDAAQRLSPLAQKYFEDEPQAAALLHDLASRRLEGHQLAELRRYVATQFKHSEGEEPVEALTDRLETRRVVLQLGGATLTDVLDVAAARFSRWEGGPSAAQLSRAFRERCEEVSVAVGAGVAVPHLSAAGAPVQAALVTLATPLHAETPDGVKPSTVVVLLSPERDRRQLARIAHVARLAARGLNDALTGVRRPVVAIERVAELEQIR